MAHALESSTVARGMTIKGILGKVDMFNFNIAEKEDFRRDVKKNLLGSSGNSSDPMAAYLGGWRTWGTDGQTHLAIDMMDF